MALTSAERKAIQRARQAAAGEKTIEVTLDNQELEMLAQNCAGRRPGREPYDISEYLTMLIRIDNAQLKRQVAELNKRNCGRCGDQLPVTECVCDVEEACWLNRGWHELRLKITP
ncbi:hypothetical protein [Pantoea cypripedii]|uniref:Uncharacterized protein n=1 Tax=Pantoea cypripedii TaxID=55209 RepID=A0A1X1ESX5_PANCY|nr:hypothetical protein [Pantoea cypripedii]MBP2197185.1 hypothetical protein [Pantoea cypripedii]ORM93118.1 hypothetical protein HA50_07070 [Pantoea cypripedii]